MVRQAGPTAWWFIDTSDTGRRRYSSADAEKVVQGVCDAAGLPWRPVPHPGGQQEHHTTEQWIIARIGQPICRDYCPPWESEATWRRTHRPVEPTPPRD